MSPAVRASAPLRAVAVVTAAATWVLLLVGCLVHGTGSSLACPDWPLCYGTLFPRMVNGVQFEHTHRLVATAVGLLSILLAVMLHRRRGVDPTGAKLGYAGVALVCVQGLLGGITVLLRLPIVVTLAHLSTSMAFFCLMVIIALRSAGLGRSSVPEPETESASLAALRLPVGLAIAATYVQIMLGGIVRHTSSGLACFGIPLCNGELWPPQAGAHLHMSHRIFAVVLGTFVIALGLLLRRRAESGSRVARLAGLAIALVLVQITLGVLSVLSLLALAPVTLHLGVAALLLACEVALYYYLPARSQAAVATKDLVELTKPRITAVVLATTAAGLGLAPVRVGALRTALALAGTVLIVSSANALNMWWERETDGLMVRTKDRPLPAGRLAPNVALAFGLLLGAVSAPLLFAVNAVTGLLGLFALVTYVAVYTPLKRHTTLALLVGAVPGAMPPLMGWTSATGSLDAGGLLLFGVLFLWQLPHFMAISLFRADDYAKAGLKVVPIEHGDRAAKWMIVGYTVLLVATSVLLVPYRVAGNAYLVVAAFLGAAFVVLGAWGLRARAARGWARSLFGYSIVYLVLLFATMIADRTSV